MGVIAGKAPKMGTLDKSKMDWNSFVNEEGIKEQLETHNRGKDGYVIFTPILSFFGKRLVNITVSYER